MAAFVQNLASTTSKTPAATTVITIVTGKLPAKGNLVLVRAAAANTSGNGAPFISSVTDTQGNKYKVGLPVSAYTNVPTDGSLAVSLLDTALAVGNTITITWSATATAAVAVVADEFSGVGTAEDGAVVSNGAGGSFSQGNTSTTPTGANNPLFTGLELVVQVLSVNGPSGETYTEDGSASSGGDTWHSLTRVGTTGGGAASNCTVAGAYKISTAAGDGLVFSWTPTIGNSRAWSVQTDGFPFSRPPYVSPLPPILAR